MTHSSHSADVRPIPNLQRKAAIATGGARDHRGDVRIAPIPGFSLERTIFNTLDGRAARFVMEARIGKESCWSERAAESIEQAYTDAAQRWELPRIDKALLEFLTQECNFDAEHADGSFLDHLYFCFEYGAAHYPQRSALPLLLHSILGTGTNTFAMAKEKIDELRSLLSEFDWRQVEAFPSVLRLLYDLPLRRELRENLGRLHQLKEAHFYRVIDNEPIVMSGEDFIVALNYQLIHFIDFLPVANWARYRSETAFLLFRDLYDLLGRSALREAQVEYAPIRGRWIDAEHDGMGALVASLLPSSLSEKLAAKQVRQFSARIGHDIGYRLVW